MSADQHSTAPPARPALLLGAAHLSALWALAIVQPLFDLLGRNPEFFVARGNTAADILLFALLFTFGPPLLMLGAEALAERVDPRVRWGLHLSLLALLAAALVLEALKELISGPAGVMIALSLAAGVAAAVLYARASFLRSLLDVLTPAPLVVLVLFLLLGDVSRLVLPQDEVEAVSVEVDRPVPVVMVVFDELPTGSLLAPGGRIDASRYPAFAELARGSTWFRRATTVAGFTSAAVPALLTGRRPDLDELPIASDQERSIFTLLGGRYGLHVMENATRLCPESLCPGQDDARPSLAERLRLLFADLRVVSEHLLLPDALRRGLPDVSQTFGGFATEAGGGPALAGGGDAEQLAGGFAAGVTEDESVRVRRFAVDLGAGDGAILHLIHVEKPHYPWTHLPDGRRYTALQSEWLPFLADDSTWQAPAYVTDIALQRHLLETGFTDRLLGRLISRLKATGLWSRALVVVAADHGGAVIAGQPRRNPNAANLGQVAPVPLFIKAPGQVRERVSYRHVCTSDALPRIAAMLGIEYPWRPFPCPADRVVVSDEPSGQAALSLARVERLEDAYVARIARTFGTGDGWAGVFRLGPHRELIGRPVGSLRQAGVPARTASSATIVGFDPAAPLAAGLLQRGALDGVAAGSPLAVAVDGRVAAVGRSFEQGEAVRYSILLPPDSLRRGPNRIELYALEDGGTRLRPLSS